MANSFIDSFSENTQDRLIKAMLECSMLFSLNRNTVLSDGRKDMFLQTVFAITCSDNREWTVKDLHDVFYERFSKDYDHEIIRKAMQKLTKDGLLIPKGNGLVPHEKIAEKNVISSVSNIPFIIASLINSFMTPSPPVC